MKQNKEPKIKPMRILKKMGAETNDIIQLKITLQETKPPIWRRVLVDKNISFMKLHTIIQFVMGWEDYHLYEFKLNDRNIGTPDNDFEDLSETNIMEASKIKLSQELKVIKQKFYYIYDFGDNWRHQIIVENFLDKDDTLYYPVCVKGKRQCPPEDCGGIGGFYRLLDILADKKGPEYEEMVEWVGEDFDENEFYLEDVNEELLEIDDYIKERDEYLKENDDE